MKDALSQPGNMSLDTQREWHDPFSVSDEFCHSHSEHLQRAANASEKRDRDGAFVREFMDFVRREGPKFRPKSRRCDGRNAGCGCRFTRHDRSAIQPNAQSIASVSEMFSER